MEMALERLQDIGERLQLLGGQRVDKVLLDGPQVGRARAPERRCAAFRQRHLGTATVGGAVVAPDEAASLHPSEVMGQPTALPVDGRRQLRRAQPRAIRFSSAPAAPDSRRARDQTLGAAAPRTLRSSAVVSSRERQIASSRAVSRCRATVPAAASSAATVMPPPD